MQTLRARCRWVPHERMVVDALTNWGGNSVAMLPLLRDGVLSIVDEDRELANRKCTGRSTNATYDRIYSWSQHKPWNETDEMQWAARTIKADDVSCSDPPEQSFLCLTRPDARQHCSWGMWCIFVCHPNLTTIICCTVDSAQDCGLETQKQVQSLSCIFGCRVSSIGFPLIVGELM